MKKTLQFILSMFAGIGTVLLLITIAYGIAQLIITYAWGIYVLLGLIILIMGTLVGFWIYSIFFDNDGDRYEF